MSIQNFMAICPTIVKIFQSGPKWWADKQTDQPTNIATLTFELKTVNIDQDIAKI